MAVLTPENEIAPDYGTLNDELDTLTKEFLGHAPTDVQEFLMSYLQRWKSSEILQEALKEGDVAPDFVLPNQDGKMVSSIDLRAKGPIVIIFFRGNWCTYCNATLRMIRKYSPHFKARGATVVAISPQTIERNKEIQKSAGLNFPILSDVSCEYAQLLNIAYVLDEDFQNMIESQGTTFQEINGTNEYGVTVLPIPATYVIQSDARVTYAYVDTDFTHRAEPLDVLNALPPMGKRRLALHELLDIEMAKLKDTYPEHRIRLFSDAIEEAKKKGIEGSALKVGDKAPDFRLAGGKNGETFDSKNFRRQGPLVVIFHHNSSLCRIQLDALQRLLPKFEAKGANLVAISPKKSTESGIKFPQLQDTPPQQLVAQKFGVLHAVPQWDGDAKELPIPSTFVIDTQGNIVYSFLDVDPSQRPDPLQVLEAIPPPAPHPLKRGPFSMIFGGRLAPRAKKRRQV
jgi:peroxiredoxin